MVIGQSGLIGQPALRHVAMATKQDVANVTILLPNVAGKIASARAWKANDVRRKAVDQVKPF